MVAPPGVTPHLGGVAEAGVARVGQGPPLELPLFGGRQEPHEAHVDEVVTKRARGRDRLDLDPVEAEGPGNPVGLPAVQRGQQPLARVQAPCLVAIWRAPAPAS